MNHHFWGDVSAWFYYYPGGIRFNPTGKDIRQLNVEPCFIEALNFAHAVHDCPEGKIQVAWKRTDAGVLLDIDVPATLTGAIRLPHGYTFEDGSTTHHLQCGKYAIVRKM